MTTFVAIDPISGRRATRSHPTNVYRWAIWSAMPNGDRRAQFRTCRTKAEKDVARWNRKFDWDVRLVQTQAYEDMEWDRMRSAESEA